MFLIKWTHIVFLFILPGYYCQRRITKGEVVTNDKTYMVYLLKASSISPRHYDNWLCGGALVSTEYIVTSAACVTDVIHLYAIAGYKKLISDTDIYTDPCTKEKKKKVIFSCIPKEYELVYYKPEKWSYIDIAIVKVESPYDFSDQSYATVCSYTPSAISINYESKYQEMGIDAMVLGWGHQTKYREDMDLKSYNQEMLNYAPVLIENKENCKKEYTVYEGMDRVIDQYMICTVNKGNLNDEGITILKSPPTAQGCVAPDVPHEQRLRGELSCEVNGGPGEIVLVENTRRNFKHTNLTKNNAELKTNNGTSKTKGSGVDLKSTLKSSIVNKLNETVVNSRRFNTRRSGICQNDHGGPLVTWVGAHEVLIGVASAYKVSETLECIGPYLYTSTQCNGAFLDCILRSDSSKTDEIRRAICKNLINGSGIQLVETHISWKDHPDGPADNEKNVTAHASVTNTINNPKNSKEKNETHQELNATKANTNITNTNDTTPTHSVENSTLTTTSNAANVNNSANTNLTDIHSANVSKSPRVKLTSGVANKLGNNTFMNVTNTASTLKNITESNSLNTETTILAKISTNIKESNNSETITTILEKIASIDLRTTTTTVEPSRKANTKTAHLIEHAYPTRTTFLYYSTTKNFTN